MYPFIGQRTRRRRRTGFYCNSKRTIWAINTPTPVYIEKHEKHGKTWKTLRNMKDMMINMKSDKTWQILNGYFSEKKWPLEEYDICSRFRYESYSLQVWVSLLLISLFKSVPFHHSGTPSPLLTQKEVYSLRSFPIFPVHFETRVIVLIEPTTSLLSGR